MANAKSPLVYSLLAPLAVLGVVGTGRMKSALWTACGEPELADYDAAIDAAEQLGWVIVDGAHVELTALGLFASQHARVAAANDAKYVPMLPPLPWPRRIAHAM